MSTKPSEKIESSVKKTKDSWFNKISSLFNRPRIEADTWQELEELLILADVGTATTDKLLSSLKKQVKEQKLVDGFEIRRALKNEMVNLLNQSKLNRESILTPDKRTAILVVGVNGSGKTTSIAKMAYYFKNKGEKVILAAADTFRAAAIEQLNHWGNRAGVEVIAHQHGADPGAVVFDTLQAAKKRGINIVIVDTAGRLHTKFNLMEELKKIKRVAEKAEAISEVLLVIDATTGQNGLIQAKQFSDAVGINGIFLTKLDGTAKGGIILAICDQLKIPILYIGTGEKLDDMELFDAESFVEAIFSS